MNDIKKAQIRKHIQYLKGVQERSGGKFNPPAWVFDESRFEKGCLTPEEMQEWAECCCGPMRSCVALSYQIECGERWGLVGDRHVFKAGSVTLEIDTALLEGVLIKNVEQVILAEKPSEAYLAVYTFYQQNDVTREGSGSAWFIDFFDEIFLNLANDIRSGKKLYNNPVIH